MVWDSGPGRQRMRWQWSGPDHMVQAMVNGPGNGQWSMVAGTLPSVMSMPLGTGVSAMSRLPMTHSSEAAPAAHVTGSVSGR